MNKLYIFFLVSYFILSATAVFSSETEELAPGYNQCIEKAQSFDEEADCKQMAHKFQSARLEKAYSRLRNLCNKAEDVNICKNELKKLELSWLDFEKRIHKYMLNEGIFGPYDYDNVDEDSIGRARNYAEGFSAHETRRQAERLELFYKLWERWQ